MRYCPEVYVLNLKIVLIGTLNLHLTKLLDKSGWNRESQKRFHFSLIIRELGTDNSKGNNCHGTYMHHHVIIIRLYTIICNMGCVRVGNVTIHQQSTDAKFVHFAVELAHVVSRVSPRESPSNVQTPL